MSDEIINRVAKSPLVQIDLTDWVPAPEAVVVLDIGNFLVEGIMFKEKEFRQKVADYNWSDLSEKYLFVTNQEEAIVPLWAYMLIGSMASETAYVGYGTTEDVYANLILQQLSNIDLEQYRDKPVIIKGCGKYELSPQVYMELTRKLQSIAKSIMFGEACSSVPIWKRKK